MADLVYKDESYTIIGACFEVYSRLGCGFLEPVYQESLEIELTHKGVPFVAQQKIQLAYRDVPLKQTYVPDFVCFETIILEIKAVSSLADEHRAQTLNYLNATGFKLGLLVNFGHSSKLEYQRILN